jgi:hypothetical protein
VLLPTAGVSCPAWSCPQAPSKKASARPIKDLVIVACLGFIVGCFNVYEAGIDRLRRQLLQNIGLEQNVTPLCICRLLVSRPMGGSSTHRLLHVRFADFVYFLYYRATPGRWHQRPGVF